MSMTIKDMEVLEGLVDADEMEGALAMQRAINGGSCWTMQGSYGRAAMDRINAGRNMLGVKGNKDYYGSYVPSRTQVKAGTKGSREFVVEAMGEAYAKALEAA